MHEHFPDTLTWRVHPARERPLAACGALAVIAAMAWLAADLMEHAGWGVFAAIVLLMALQRFFVPSEYRIDAEGVTVRLPWRTQRYRWAAVRRFVYGARGGFLSSRARPSALDAFRGIPLLFDRRREEVISCIRRHLPEESRCAG